MAWTKGTPLVATVDELRQLTGLTDLATLEDDAELAISNVLTTASDQLYVHLVDQGVDPSDLTNSADFKYAVAHHAWAMLVRSRLLKAPEGQVAPDDPFTWSLPHLRRVKPQVSSNARPQIGWLRPKARNLGKGYF